MSRLPPLDPANLDDAQRSVHDRIASGARGSVGGPFTVLLQSSELASRVEQLGLFLRYDCSVPQRLRELAILVVAQHWRADYEWYAHAGIAQSHGLEAEAIAAVGTGRTPRFEQPADAATFAFVRELLNNGRVADATYVQLQDLLGNKGSVELTGLVGYYTLLAFQLNVFEVAAPSDGPAVPWR